MQPHAMTAAHLAQAIRDGEVSAREAVDDCLARIERHNPACGAFLDVYADTGRAEADAVDRSRAADEPLGPLAGVPVAVKDNLCVPGRPTTCASRMLADYTPPHAAHVVDRLREAGAVVIGKTNLDEFAMGSSNENSALGVTRNPWNPDCVPGGSSGGSAAAVAAGFAPLALGSDTGGSIRTPAGFCGCVGMKPTYGAVSRWGLVAFGSSLDQIGPLARTVEDAARLYAAIAGPDPRDGTCRNAPPPDVLTGLEDGVKGLRVGLPREYFETDGLDADVRQTVEAAVDALREGGAKTVEVSLPLLDYAVETYYVIATAEASSNLARYDGAHYGHRSPGAGDIIEMFAASRDAALGPEVKRRIMLGTYVLSAGYYDAYYLRALRVRTRIAEEFSAAFETADVLASPVCPTTAFRFGAKVDDPVRMYLSDIYTISANLAALPAVSIPCGEDGAGLPVGFQLMAPRFRDDLVFRAARAAELALGRVNRIAPLGADAGDA